MARATQETKYFPGLGRRKTAIAQIRLQAGNGQFTINGEKTAPHDIWLKPLMLVGKRDQSDVSIVVRGGGIQTRGEAISLGIARALIAMDDTLKPTLRKAGLVTVDGRVKERKKPGLKGARKAPQWSKR